MDEQLSQMESSITKNMTAFLESLLQCFSNISQPPGGASAWREGGGGGMH